MSASWNLSSLGECERLSLVHNIAEFEAAFVAYGRAVCDGLVSDCFVLDNADFVRHAAGICDVLRHSCHLDPSAMGQVCDLVATLDLCRKWVVTLSNIKKYSVAHRRTSSRICDGMIKILFVSNLVFWYILMYDSINVRTAKQSSHTKLFRALTCGL